MEIMCIKCAYCSAWHKVSAQLMGTSITTAIIDTLVLLNGVCVYVCGCRCRCKGLNLR